MLERNSTAMTEPSLQRLLDENRRLTEVVRAKDQFIATLSHELRNQLPVIQGWMAMLKTGNLSSERSEHAMRVIDRSLQAQHVLLEDLLDLSAALQGKLTLAPQSVD